MTLHILKPTLGYQRSTLPMLQRQAPQQVVQRLTGNTLRAVRTRLFARSGQLCECPECQATYPMKLTWETFEVDHVLALYLGGTHAWDNLRAVHVDCHARITAQQRAERDAMGGTALVDTAAPAWGSSRPAPRPAPGANPDDEWDMPC